MTGLPIASTKLTLLQIIDNVCNEIALAAPSFVVGNTDATATQMLALANREGNEFFQAANIKGGWEVLRKEYTFTTVASASGLTCTTVSGSPTLTAISSTSSVVVGQVAVGSGIPVGTTVTAIPGATSLTLSANCTLSATAVSFYTGQDNYALPDDLDHFMTQTFWDRNFRWQLLGPLSAQEWQVLKSGISPTGPRRRFRVMSNRFYIDPVPSDSTSVEVYEYYSNGWAQSTGGTSGTPKVSFTVDTDNYLLDDNCMQLGIKWRFLRAKRLSWDQEFLEYSMAKERVMSRDGADRNLPLNASASGVRLLNEQNVPDTGYGS